ncbi:MAG: Site-2 protease [Microgenomates group bacterium GW2011_GWB1_46_7]|nr:MAG: Site-2 protease [Microgenomates group bacterium GW2011_GWB1_46_7]
MTTILVLSLLVLLHELGHFLVAKLFGIKVEEFGIGLPPKAVKLGMWGETEFSLNWLPIGGFVRLAGEEEDPSLWEKINPMLRKKLFFAKPAWQRALVTVAGVAMNFLFAWLLISLGFVIGMPSSATSSLPVENAQTVVTSVLPGSPAKTAGLKAGDTILFVSRGEQIISMNAEAKADFIASSDRKVLLSVKRGEELLEIPIIPEFSQSLQKPVIGVSMDEIGIAKLSPIKAIWRGLQTSLQLTILTAEALFNLVVQAVQGGASLEGLTGPVGLVGIVGDASILGFAYLLSLTALISINLTLINLLPFPALDGGRLLVVLVEAISRRSIPAKITGALNAVGFALLIFLMVLVTVQDIANIF